VQSTSERCPTCGTELSTVKYQEIQAKIKQEERTRSAEERQRLAEAEATTRHRLEEQFKQDLEKQKQAAAKQAKQEAEQKIGKMTAERDEAIKKLKEAEGREADVRKQVLEEAEKRHQKELSQQRQTLEKAGGLELLKQQSQFNRERESYQRKMQVMERQLQKKTANELGDGAEIDVFEQLRDAFQGDRITRIRKGEAGADILHEVLHKGQVCGRIVTDSKNHQGWQNGFVTKLRHDQVEAGAEHAILASTVFPAGKKEMCIESDVIVVNPARVVHVTQILRQAMVAMHVQGLSMKERNSKMGKLYKLITSEAYSCKFNEAGKLTKDILDLDVQEKKSHDTVWKKRGTLATRLGNVLREIDTEVAAVIEGEEEAAPPAFGVKRARETTPKVAAEEAVVWNKR